MITIVNEESLLTILSDELCRNGRFKNKLSFKKKFSLINMQLYRMLSYMHVKGCWGAKTS